MVTPDEVRVWELVVAMALMVPVLSKPPLFLTGWLVVVVTPLTTLVMLSVTSWDAVSQVFVETELDRQVK